MSSNFVFPPYSHRTMNDLNDLNYREINDCVGRTGCCDLSAKQDILVIVHPGSPCGSADFNLGGIATEARKLLINDIAHWHHGMIVIDGELSDELLYPPYQPLHRAINMALARAQDLKLTSIRQYGHDPDQVQVIQQVIRELGLPPENARFFLTGAWLHSRDGGGCVGSVHQVLCEMNFCAVVRDSAVDLDVDLDGA